jgi:hypothetical protein
LTEILIPVAKSHSMPKLMRYALQVDELTSVDVRGRLTSEKGHRLARAAKRESTREKRRAKQSKDAAVIVAAGGSARQ